MKSSCMSRGGGVMYGVGDGLSFMWGNVHLAFEVQMAVGHVPIIHGGAGEQGGPFFQAFQCPKYQEIRFREGLDLSGEGEIKRLDDDRFWTDCCLLVI